MKKSYEDLADWLYEEGRNEGDITNIPVKGDTKDPEKVTGHIIAYYVDENEETWKLNGRNSIANEKVTEWFEEAVEKYGVTVDYEFETETENHDGHDHDDETTASTEATTQAATEATTEAATEAGTTAE